MTEPPVQSLESPSGPELVLTHFMWAKQVVIEEYPDIEKAVFEHNMPLEEWVMRYLLWAVYNGVLHTFGSPLPTAMILVRKMASEKLGFYRAHYYDTLYEYDPAGDTAYVDFCYAPGNYSFIINFLQRLGTKYIGWIHASTGKFHLVESTKMPAFGASELAFLH